MAEPEAQIELHLDEATGERVSKTELKKRIKAREKENKKSERLASRPAPIQKKAHAENEEKEVIHMKSNLWRSCLIVRQLNPNQYFEIRSRNIQKLRESQDPIPYPHKFKGNLIAFDRFIEQYKGLKSGEHKEDIEVRVAGRIYNKRASGTKLVFYDIKSNGVRLQIMCQSQAQTSVDFEKQHEHLRRGDIIGVVGYPGRTAPKTKIEKGSAHQKHTNSRRKADFD